MKVLVIGGSGMLGHKLVSRLKNDFDVYATVRDGATMLERAEILDRERIFENVEAEEIETVDNVIKKLKPEVVVNCVGIVKQLPTSRNIVATLRVNSIFPHLLRQVTESGNARLITISTDCVFDGQKGNYTETDIPNAPDVYGKSKYLGEIEGLNALTLRTSIIGRELQSAHSLVEWFIGNEKGSVKGFAKAIYTGFPTYVFADIIIDLIKNHPRLTGLYHISSEPINKYDLLCLIKDAYGLPISIEKDEKFVIDRSLNSDKFRRETGFVPVNWREMIRLMANDSAAYRKKIGAGFDESDKLKR